ncbi:hypothetical protein [Flavilitoribacter nigricans]|uniref:PH domain-containing protein n=1 Tax=Flavilitoribacter nigricans (strain ATCC 23147 / DSM 23189 / NBRC 102662 / NCIMB 1420 / SS-2) TaxID=1122177 RepID=A0A2D0NHJ5_FLAN2|nr:hypothetical protein [Flavilitoribacter nigricans]PHN07972.1 hypothetical protein CRP01_04250 [Flavilitoribacter nigricans DSM 23189 = NBRC 102662]
MQLREKIFKYRAGERVGELLTMCGIVMLSVFVLDTGAPGGVKIVLTVIFSCFLLFMLHFSYILNDHLRVSDEQITFHRRIGTSRIIAFPDVRRIVIRETPNAFGSTHFALTVFGPENYVRIIASDLEHYDELVDLLELEASIYGFKVIYQGINGEILGNSSSS